jgi:intracellular septation protein A
MPPATFDVPSLRVLARHAAPRLVEAVLIPTLLFLVLLRLGGQSYAIVGAFAWSALVIGTRLALRRPIPTLVFIGLGALGLRTALALASHSSFVYFLQPTVGNATVGILFLATALAGKPLILRMARDFCPLPEDVMTHGHLRRFFLGISVLWGTVQLLNAGLTLWLLLSQSLGTFVVLRTTMTHTLTVTAITISVVWFRRITRVAPEPEPAFAVTA